MNFLCIFFKRLEQHELCNRYVTQSSSSRPSHSCPHLFHHDANPQSYWFGPTSLQPLRANADMTVCWGDDPLSACMRPAGTGLSGGTTLKFNWSCGIVLPLGQCSALIFHWAHGTSQLSVRQLSDRSSTGLFTLNAGMQKASSLRNHV